MEFKDPSLIKSEGVHLTTSGRTSAGMGAGSKCEPDHFRA